MTVFILMCLIGDVNGNNTMSVHQTYRGAAKALSVHMSFKENKEDRCSIMEMDLLED